MKKILLISLISFCSFLSVNAQWTSATNLQSTANNVVIKNNIASSEVKLEIGNTNLSGYSVIRFSDAVGDKAYLHRFNSGWNIGSTTSMWEANSISLYESIGSMNIGGKSSFKVFTGSENSERLRVDANGNVGIGTISPLGNLDIFTALPATGGYNSQYWSTNNSGYNLKLQTYWDINGINYNFIQRFAGNDYNVLSFSGGKVGIGTTTPQALFSVYGNSNGWMQTIKGSVTDVNQFIGVKLQTGYMNDEGKWAGIAAIGENIHSNSTGLGFFASQAERMRITGTGNVGIGTTTPQAKLHIANGDNSYGAILAQASEAEFQLYTKSLTTNPAAGQDWSNVESFRIGMKYSLNGNNHENNGFISFYRAGNSEGGYLGFSTAGIERIRISSNGYVGIGTNNPDKELTVKGTIHAREVLVDLNGPLADFVFAPSYKLKSLAEVEAFVKENNHLPEIPSAAEAKANGVNLGEMQNKLLQKIEELTLYTIELEKSRNEETQKREALEARLAKLESLLQK